VVLFSQSQIAQIGADRHIFYPFLFIRADSRYPWLNFFFQPQIAPIYADRHRCFYYHPLIRADSCYPRFIFLQPQIAQIFVIGGYGFPGTTTRVPMPAGTRADDPKKSAWGQAMLNSS
jgi:hypothetical protein